MTDPQLHHLEPAPDELAALRGLRATPPRDLFSRLAAYWVRLPTPVADVFVAFSERGVALLRTVESLGDDPHGFVQEFHELAGRPLLAADSAPRSVERAVTKLDGRGLRLDLPQLSPFERSVLSAAAEIPSGQTRPYGWVARRIERSGAVRAVGSALGRNPVPLLIPCHRVVRSDGRIGEYVFGAPLKDRLLRYEGANIDEMAQLGKASVHYLGSDTTHIVCFISCRAARRITPRHRREFRSVAAALAAGYRPCRLCEPGVMASAPG